ncbi:hypothetical protein G6F31_020991 [Rhizopus arrhizus]|nr:hypothetical protein G6F31_020991 [Rhizopus arrhizus]
MHPVQAVELLADQCFLGGAVHLPNAQAGQQLAGAGGKRGAAVARQREVLHAVGVAAAGGFRLRMAMAVIMGMVMLVVMSVLVRMVVARMIVTGMIVFGMIMTGVIVPRLAPRVAAACAAGVFLLGGQGL